MKKKLIAVLLLLPATIFGQSVSEVITNVFKAQQALKTVSYTLKRTDSLVTGDIRTMTGNSRIIVDQDDTVFGFKFWSKKDNDNNARIYDGHLGYEINPGDKTYALTTNHFDYFLVNGGGQIILTDLIKLDTSRAIGFGLRQDAGFYYLTIKYADLKEYDVSQRSKTIQIKKGTLLPVSVRHHQETLGKVQDLYYQVQELKINNPSFNDDFSSPDFLKGYQQQLAAHTASPVMDLKNKPAPDFNLLAFDGSRISLSKLNGKVLLLDFWEVWCGPCIESMPKVQHLYNEYGDKGLEVYGIINEVKELESSRRMVKKSAISFPMLIGNAQLKKDYKISGIPLYILIDKKGKIIFVSEGYSGEMEAVIKKAIAG